MRTSHKKFLRRLGIKLCVIGVGTNAALATLSNFGHWPGGVNTVEWVVVLMTAVAAAGMLLLAKTQKGEAQ